VKRFRRRLFNAAVMLSPPLCILWLALWPLSFLRKTYVIRTNQQSNIILAVLNGYLIGTYQSGPGMIARIGARPDSWEFGFDPPVKGVPILWGYSILPTYFSRPGPNFLVRRVTIPLWVLVLASGTPWAAERIWKWRHSREAGLCPVCGYDLRATPQRCPECGTIPRKHEIKSN
jgi:hypothetical protein